MAGRNRVPLVPRPGPTEDPEVGKVLSVHADAIRDLQSRPITDGYLLKDVELTTSRAVLRHGLKRPAHYEVVRRNAPAHVYDEPADDSLDELWLLADADVTVTLWIF